MRTAFIEALVEAARADPRVFLLTADLGWSVLERFADAFPQRFLNVGVAEQNLAGIATGLAQIGYVPYIYSIANFVSMRCYEQVRNGPVLHGLPVRVVGVGGGYAYGHAGPSHHALEDLSIFRAQPGLTVLAPADPAQARTALWETLNLPGPVYFRIGKGGNPHIPGLEGRFALGRPEVVRPGTELLFLATGAIAVEAVQAAETLRRVGVSAAVAVMAHVGFTPSAKLVELLAEFPVVVAVEEGFTAGGLGSLIAEAVASRGLRCRVSLQGVTETFPGVSGSAGYMQAQCGLTAERLCRVGESLMDRRRAA
jgi:transketolase